MGYHEDVNFQFHFKPSIIHYTGKFKPWSNEYLAHFYPEVWCIIKIKTWII